MILPNINRVSEGTRKSAVSYGTGPTSIADRHHVQVFSMLLPQSRPFHAFPIILKSSVDLFSRICGLSAVLVAFHSDLEVILGDVRVSFLALPRLLPWRRPKAEPWQIDGRRRWSMLVMGWEAWRIISSDHDTCS